MSELKNYFDDFDPAFPGEGWFCYWKTSASLWPSRLSRLKANTRPLLIPIYWAFHTTDDGNIDLGEEKPESHLKKLAELVFSLQLEAYFLLPLTPIPFWPNGGIPSFLAKTLALDEQGMAYGIVDSEGRVHKFYGLFDPKTFQSFHFFVRALKKHFDQLPFAVHILGMTGGAIENERFYSYLQDSSPSFQEGFAKYVSLQNRADGLRDPDKIVEEDLLLQWEFKQTIKDLYLSTSQHYLKEYWEGEVRYAFLGGRASDIFTRALEKGEEVTPYFPLLAQCFALNVVPSIQLLPVSSKKGILCQLMEKLVDRSYFLQQIQALSISAMTDYSFRPFGHFLLFDHPQYEQQSDYWQDLGLTTFLQKNLPFLYRRYQQIGEVCWDEITSHQIFCFSSRDLSLESFHRLLQLFMNGHTLIWDRSGVAGDIERRIDGLLLENGITTEKLFYGTELEYAQLGTGRLIMMKGELLMGLPMLKQEEFWRQIWEALKIPIINFKLDEELYCFWKWGTPTRGDKSFDEIRRLLVVNPSSYKKNLSGSWEHSFALIRFLDEGQVKMKQIENGVEIELKPQSMLTLDFGVLYE